MRTTSTSRGTTASRPVYITSVPRDVVTSRLSVGQVIRGTVIEQLADDLYIINFRGFNLNSQSKRRFKRGKRIFVRVIDITDQIVMQLVPEEEYTSASIEAASAELETCLEEMGIPPNPLNTFIANAMLQFGMPLSLQSFTGILDHATKLALDNENDLRTLVYLSSKKYPPRRTNIDLANYLGLPRKSVLLGEVMAMLPRKPHSEGGQPFMAFEADRGSAICVRYDGERLGLVRAVAVIDGHSATVELICESESQTRTIASLRSHLESLLAERNLKLSELHITLDEPDPPSSSQERNGIHIGIDFKV